MIEIKDKNNCCGCYACFNVCPKKAITMIEDKKGFKYPKVDKNICVDCNLCEKVCPILHNSKIKNEPKAFACMNNSDETRKNSSSGGIFSLIATYVINQGGIVFGVKWKDEFSGVEHSFVDNINDLQLFRGAKYLQSDVNESYIKTKKFLDEGKYVLFSGTPCQIEGLNAFLNKKYDKLFLQDIICHGVPSPKAWRTYKSFLSESNKSQITNVQFRSKEEAGWNNYHVKIDFENGSTYKVNHNNDFYMKAFLSNICLRDSCTSCKFKKENRVSDITLADFWGINDIIPKMNDERGTSLIIVNSAKGQHLFDEISTYMKYREVDFKTAIKPNPSMTKPSNINSKTNDFFEELDVLPFDVLTNKYIKKSSILKRGINKIKKMAKSLVIK